MGKQMANPLLFRSLLRDAPLANASNQQGAAAFASPRAINWRKW